MHWIVRSWISLLTLTGRLVPCSSGTLWLHCESSAIPPRHKPKAPECSHRLYGITCTQTFMYSKDPGKDSRGFRLVVRSPMAILDSYAYSTDKQQIFLLWYGHPICLSDPLGLKLGQGPRHPADSIYVPCIVLLSHVNVRPSNSH